MKNIKAIIFDLDDTLISEYDYILSGYSVVSKYISNKYLMDEGEIYNKLIELFTESPKNIFNRLFYTYSIKYKEEDIVKLVNIYRNHYPIIEFYDDVIPTLLKLKESGYKLGIITDGYKETQRKKVKALNLEKYVDHIIVTDELGREYWKPHPKAFEIMKEKLNVAFNEMIYIGDNPTKDFYISSLYPIKTIRIKRGCFNIYSNEEYLDDVKEHYNIKDISDLFKLIKK